MAHLVAGAAHAAADDVIGILRPAVQPRFERLHRGRQQEHADDIGPGALAQLLGALPVDIEQHVMPGGQRILHRLARRAVAVVEHGRPFEQFAARRHGFKARLVDEAIVAALDFPRPDRTRRHRHRHPHVRHSLHQHPRHRGLAGARWRRQHEHQPAPLDAVKSMTA